MTMPKAGERYDPTRDSDDVLLYDDSDGTYDYYGRIPNPEYKAAAGATSTAIAYVKRVLKVAPYTAEIATTANNQSGGYDQIWDNRATLNYDGS